MIRLNVQVKDDLYSRILEYASRYRINKSAAVSCLLAYALEWYEIEQFQRFEKVQRPRWERPKVSKWDLPPR